MEALNLVLDTMTQIGVSFVKSIPLFIAGILVIAGFNYIAGLLQNLVKEISDRSSMDFTLASILASLTGISVRILGVLLAAVVVIPSFEPGSKEGMTTTDCRVGSIFRGHRFCVQGYSPEFRCRNSYIME